MKPEDATEHKTSHAAQADADGRVLAYCQNCGWSEDVDVSGLSWQAGMEAIFAARDRHEADAKARDLKPAG